MPLHSTSLLPFCPHHFMPLHFASHHFTSLHATSRHFTLTVVSLEYFSHLLNIFHICKDSDMQKIPLPENTILRLGQNLKITFSTSCHFTSPPLCLTHFTPLCATSLHLPFCLPHFTPLHFTSHSVHLTSCHFTPLHFTSHSVHLHFMPLHSTSLHLPSFCLTSPHLTSSHPSSHQPALLLFADNASLATLHQKSTASSVNAQSSKHACQPASPALNTGLALI